jgi:hypothetical protein
MWNTGPQWSSSSWFYPRLVLLLFPAFSRRLKYRFSYSFPGCSWSTPLPCTLKVPVHRVFSLIHVMVYVVEGQSKAILFPLIVVQRVFALHSAIIPHLKFYPATRHLKYVVVIGLEWITYPFSYFPHRTPVQYEWLNIRMKQLHFSRK